jgi:hypothetical protein
VIAKQMKVGLCRKEQSRLPGVAHNQLWMRTLSAMTGEGALEEIRLYPIRTGTQMRGSAIVASFQSSVFSAVLTGYWSLITEY